VTDELPAPLTPVDADLRAFQFTPIFRSRLFGSSFHARVNDSEWRAGVTLWLKSWDQVPAGSLPNDDIDLCRLAELGRDIRAWKKHRDGALRGWILCSDGRLYHPVVAEGINEALDGKRKQQEKTLAARIGAMKKRLAEAKSDEAKASMAAEIETMSQTLLQLQSQKGCASVTDNVTGSVTSTNREGKGKGQGDRKGKGEGYIYTAHAGANGSASVTKSVTERGQKGRDSIELTESEHHERFERIKAAYPKFSNRQDWINAEAQCRNHVGNGDATWESLLAVTDRYAKHIRAKGDEGTQYVKTPGRFFAGNDADAFWRQEWPIPTPANGKSRPAPAPVQYRTADEIEADEIARAIADGRTDEEIARELSHVPITRIRAKRQEVERA
jgi:hypothetical protein